MSPQTTTKSFECVAYRHRSLSYLSSACAGLASPTSVGRMESGLLAGNEIYRKDHQHGSEKLSCVAAQAVGDQGLTSIGTLSFCSSLHAVETNTFIFYFAVCRRSTSGMVSLSLRTLCWNRTCGITRRGTSDTSL